LAPLSKLEDDKIYSEIPESQFWPEGSEVNNRSYVSEEAIRNSEYEEEEDDEVVK